jgi:4-aminobutyrate aminotransferase/(S)-3-amino-2-methylpropionate transaminase
VYHAPFPYEHRGVSTKSALAALHELFDASAPPDRVAAIVIEPVLGEGGFVPVPRDFFHELRRLTTEHGIVLIADEIQTGFARTGKFFACEHYGIEPDLIATAKSIAGGLPLSAVTGKAEIMDAPGPGGLGGTFAGNPIACAAAMATFEVMDDAFFARAGAIGKKLRSAFDALAAAYPQIVDVRAIGPMVAMELSTGADRIVEAARNRGLLLMLAGKRDVIRVLVPLVISDSELDEALAILSECAREVLA